MDARPIQIRRLALVCSLTAFVLTPGVGSAQVQFVFDSDEPQVVASASAVIPVHPDRVLLYVAIAGVDGSAGSAISQATATRDIVVAALIPLGYDPDAITPWGFAFGSADQMRQMPQRPDASRPSREFTSRLGLRIIVEPVDRLAAVVKALIDAGIESIPNASFEAVDTEDARRQAVGQAVSQARQDAEAMAAAAGGRLGELLRVYTTPDLASSIFATTRFLAGGFDRGVTLSPSDVMVRVSVQASWRFLSN